MDTTTAPDLSDRACLVTGANRGLGLATCIELARAGAQVTLVCRDADRAVTAAEEVRRAAESDRVDYLIADLASQRSIRALAAQYKTRHAVLDVLVNNAATVSERRRTTVDGRERTFAVNHLAPFLLTRLLLDRLKAAPHGIIINVAAANHRDAVEHVEDLDSLDGYEMRAAYKRSKLANVSFTRELARRLDTSTRVNSFCPGVVATELLMQFRRVPVEHWADRLVAEESPRTAAMVAMSLVITPGTGRYLEDGVDVAPAPLACDPAFGRWLWDRCCVLTNLDPS
jgi:NAD(P)-dependent dehydrogenase (short-subunit alcohol dehydrogenase family)